MSRYTDPAFYDDADLLDDPRATDPECDGCGEPMDADDLRLVDDQWLCARCEEVVREGATD